MQRPFDPSSRIQTQSGNVPNSVRPSKDHNFRPRNPNPIARSGLSRHSKPTGSARGKTRSQPVHCRPRPVDIIRAVGASVSWIRSLRSGPINTISPPSFHGFRPDTSPTADHTRMAPGKRGRAPGPRRLSPVPELIRGREPVPFFLTCTQSERYPLYGSALRIAVFGL